MIGQAERLYQINSLINNKTETNGGPKIISITSGKGGTGKSFIASNIATELANSGVKVLLVDLDINLANQNVLFNLNAKKSFYQYLNYSECLEDIIIHHSNNLHLILGESGKLDHPKLNEDNVNLLIKEFKEMSNIYDVILLDTSSGIENGTLKLLTKSDEIIIVSAPEPTSVMDAYVICKLLKSQGCLVSTSLIVNKCLQYSEGQETFNKLKLATKHFLNSSINYLGEISFSEKVIRSIQDQSPLAASNQSDEICTQMSKISSKLKKATIG